MPIAHARAAGAAGVLVLVLLAGRVSAQPASQPLSILDVPFISQSEALCGGAAAAMVLRYWGERGLDAESFAHLVDRSAAGIRTTRLVGDLNDRGWNATAVDGTDELVARELARGRPVLTLIEDRPGTFHYVVIVASTPRAVVFHDPARAPFRVMDRDAFAERWAAADRWMAIVVPGERAPEPPAPAASTAVPGASSCDQLIEVGVRQAQSSDLAAAERSLTAALSCGGSAPLRELAGLRLLQRRWTEVGELASAAVMEDPGDTHAWELLATSRFVQDDSEGALEAWNRIDRPRVDLVVVDGLTRTRPRVVERLLAVPPEAVLTTRLFGSSARRLSELPSAVSTRLEFVPMSSGLAELRAHVVERSLFPASWWSYVAIGVRAAAVDEVGVSTGSLTGGGERIEAAWRYWPERPRVRLAVAAPAPWGGLLGLDASGERQPFSDDALPEARRAGVGMTISNWVSPWVRASLRGGLDTWVGRGRFGVASGGLQLASGADRVVVGLDGSAWAGPSRFGSFAALARVRSSSELRGLVYVARGGVATATAYAPPDIWPAGDSGRTRPILLRAHPLIERERVRVDRIGRHIAHVSAEAQRWVNPSSLFRLGGAVFVDTASVWSRLSSGSRGDVDVGVGLRVARTGLGGFRLDIAKGLRDGATAVSFAYEP